MTRRYRICKTRRTPAGTATESIGLFLWAVDADSAVANAKQIFPWAGSLVAIAEEN